MSKYNPSKPRSERDSNILILNNLGISLTSIAEELNIPLSTVSSIVRNYKVNSSDGRKPLMEEVYSKMTPEQISWVSSKLSTSYRIEDLIRSLLINKYEEETGIKSSLSDLLKE